jgi:hypothetical protein
MRRMSCSDHNAPDASELLLSTVHQRQATAALHQQTSSITVLNIVNAGLKRSLPQI